MKDLLELLVSAFKWAMKRPRLAAEGLLVVSLVFAGWRYNMALEAIQSAKDEHAQLEEELGEKITLKDGQIEILRREGGKVVVSRPYFPPEGSVIIKRKDLSRLRKRYSTLLAELKAAKTPEDRKRLEDKLNKVEDDLNAPAEVIVKARGFTHKLGWGVEVGRRGITPRLDLKWYYLNRWSTMVGGSKFGLGAGISRHIDDIMWTRPKHVEVFAEYKLLRFDEKDWKVIGGIRTNF